MGLHWEQSNLRSGLVACTGNSYCKFASSNTKSHALELADYLEKRVDLDQPINIHLTGCPNSCAQHYMGDIGLLGAKVLVPCPQRGREIAMFPLDPSPDETLSHMRQSFVGPATRRFQPKSTASGGLSLPRGRGRRQAGRLRSPAHV